MFDDSDPTPGEQWVLKPEDGDQFEEKNFHPVKIVDVKNGWVRYDMGYAFKDQRLEQSMFTKIYRRVSNA